MFKTNKMCFIYFFVPAVKLEHFIFLLFPGMSSIGPKELSLIKQVVTGGFSCSKRRKKKCEGV